MANDGTVKIGTELDKSGLKNGLSGLGSFAQKGFSIIKSAADMAAKAIAGVSAALGAAAVAGIKYNSTIEQYQTSFEVMTGSAEKAAEVTERLKELGAATPFELPELANTTQLLMNYGFTADDAIAKMQMLGDISQGSADKMDRIATAYGQMSSAGKVSLEDVKQMIEAGFNPLQEISNSTGESMESLYQRISNGTLTVDEITAAMQRATSEGGQYYQSMEKQSKTMEGLISTLKDNALSLAGEVVQPLTEEIKNNLLPGAIAAIEQLSTAFKENGVDGLIQAGSEILNNILMGITQKAPDVITAAFEIINSFLLEFQNNIPQFLAAGGQILSAFISGIFSAIPTLGSIGIQIVSDLLSAISENNGAVLLSGSQTLNDFISGFVSKIPDALTSGVEMIVSLAEALTNPDTLSNIINAAISLVENLVVGLLEAIPKLLEAVPVIIANLVSALIANVPRLLEAALNIMVALGRFLVESIHAITTETPKIFEQLVTNFKNMDWAQIGQNLIDGIKDGIVKTAYKLADAAIEAAKSAVKGVKDFLGIHSPSRLARDVLGKNFVAGFYGGIEDETPKLQRTATISSEKAVQAMQGAAHKRTASITEEANQKVRAKVDLNDDPGNGSPKVVIEKGSIEGNVYLEGKVVGKMVAPIVDQELGKMLNDEERGS